MHGRWPIAAVGIAMWVSSVLIAWNDSESGWGLLLALLPLGGLLIGIGLAGRGCGAFFAVLIGAGVIIGVIASMWDLSPLVVLFPFVGLGVGWLVGS